VQQSEFPNVARCYEPSLTLLPIIKLMKLSVFSISALCALGVSSHAGQADARLQSRATKNHQNQNEAFAAEELQIDAFAIAGVGNHAGPFRRDAYGLGLGAAYFPTLNFGLGIDGAWLRGDENSTRGTGKVDLGQFSASVILRMPLQDLRLAPYGFAGGGVTTGASTIGSVHLGAGLEYRIVPNQIGLFGDTRWTYYGDRFSRADVNNFQFRAGLKFVF
jgi:hypothetical protein